MQWVMAPVGVPTANHDVPRINQPFLIGESNTSQGTTNQEPDHEREWKTPTNAIMKAVITTAMIRPYPKS